MAYSTDPLRDDLLRKVGFELGRKLSTQTVFLHQLIASKLGVNATDTRCLELISRAEETPVTAGYLARATGLTTGAVTGILDRLEAAGLVARLRDSDDRRRVLVQITPGAAERVGPLYEGLGDAVMKLTAGYSKEELELISDFLENNLAILHDQINRLS